MHYEVYRIENCRDIGTALYIKGLKPKAGVAGKLFVFLDDLALPTVEEVWAVNRRDPLSQKTRIAFVGWIAAQDCCSHDDRVLQICQSFALHSHDLDECVDAVIDALREEKILLCELRIED